VAALSSGAVAPDFTLTTMDGKPFSLSQAIQRGPVLLVFFKISCPVCQYALPFIERLYQAYRGKNVTVAGVSQNSRKDTALFQKEYGVTFPMLLDDPANYKVSNAYGLTNVPTILLIAPDGTIEVSSVGWSRADIVAINAKLAEHLQARQAVVFHDGEDVAEWKAG
jgi:peroxiredoxin